MKLSEAKNLNKNHQLKKAHLMRSPSNPDQWFITLRLISGESFLLADEDDQVIVDSNLENLFQILKGLGFHMAKITF
ncbi:MAG: hypothetical protein R3240_09100 [Gammaproteobacteria bacterium]|nr:hypothetical protein [Gammaproteobacteria bacterium]